MILAVCFTGNVATPCTVVGDPTQGCQLQMPWSLPSTDPNQSGGPIASVPSSGLVEGRPLGASGPNETFRRVGAYVVVSPVAAQGQRAYDQLFLAPQVG
jgi:hypothetical protein